ncbi:amino acid transporter [Protomyces lactucae-debilis]|uniref:Amino acid transporter n=1 Tax=Protomyces lactucae-debilis TaxID=2754530 RepID=A0A1Y2FHW3_PROLT|nr:amino acid transporter [Protomyces lactucae-debilis]ORY83197.1 amino acid transporter [Protomyces lactucae-debilis]
MPSDIRKHVGSASFSSSFINLANTIIGAGVLAMPHAMATLGIFGGILVITFAGMTSGFGLYLLTRCAKYVEDGRASFFQLSRRTYPSAAIFFDLAIALKTFGVAVSYLIIISNLMPQIIHAAVPSAKDSDFLMDRRFWLTVFMIIIVPLSFLRRLDSLKYTSVVSLFAIGYLVLLVVGHWITGDTLPDRGLVKLFEWKGFVKFLNALPVFVFAFTCHQNILSIVNEIEDTSQRQINGVVATSIGGSWAVYLLVAITGYLSYGDKVNGNIVSMYPNSISANIGRTAIVVLILFSYPLQAHPCRASLDKIIVSAGRAMHLLNEKLPVSRTISRHSSSVNLRGMRQEPEAQEEHISDLRWTLLTTFILIATYMVAFAVSSLEVVLSYVGATGSTAISFILPGLFYWRITGDSEDYLNVASDEQAERDTEGDGESAVWSQSEKQRRYTRYGAAALGIYGVVFMVVCLTLNIVGSARHSGH